MKGMHVFDSFFEREIFQGSPATPNAGFYKNCKAHTPMHPDIA